MLHLCISGKLPVAIVIISSLQILKSKFIDSFNSFIQFRVIHTIPILNFEYNQKT